MDSQGFVFLSVLAKFNRIRQLTQDFELVRYVCVNLPQMEFRTGADGHDRLRKREGWQQWILAVEDRDPSVQNDGPGQLQHPYMPQQPFQGALYGFDSQQSTLNAFAENSPYQLTDAAAVPHPPVSPSRPAVNGQDNISGIGQMSHSNTMPDHTAGSSAPHRTGSTPSDSVMPVENSFTDGQVDFLVVVVRKSPTHQNMSPPFHTAASRTFSNGSIDARTLKSESTTVDGCLKQSNNNGDSSADM